MGLAERRALKDFKEGTYKDFETKIFEAANKKLEIEVDWDSLTEDEMDHLYEEAFSNVYFFPLIEALKNISFDEMGKKALENGLEKIVIANTKANSVAEYWAIFENKVLYLDHKPTTNIHKPFSSDRIKVLQKILENNL